MMVFIESDRTRCGWIPSKPPARGSCFGQGPLLSSNFNPNKGFHSEKVIQPQNHGPTGHLCCTIVLGIKPNGDIWRLCSNSSSSYCGIAPALESSVAPPPCSTALHCTRTLQYSLSWKEQKNRMPLSKNMSSGNNEVIC